MRSSLLARGRALTGCACVALVAGLAGCAGTAANSNGSSVSGHTLTIYLSMSKPFNELTPEQQDVISAEKLALRQLSGRVGSFTVNDVEISGNELSDNARGAISDPTTIAYLGELQPGASGQTIGITNAQDILQVSPTDTAIALTQTSPEVSGSPGNYYESLSSNGHTFARVTPNDKLEAKALVGEMQSLGVTHVWVISDHTDYGNALAGLLRADTSSISASSLTSANGIVYAGGSVAAAAQTFNQAASSSASVKLFAPSALATKSFASALSPAAQRETYVSSPGFTATDLPSQAAQFASSFKTAYGHAPATEAIFGYEAMAAVLSVLQKAGSSANNRGTVIKDFLGIRNRSSVLGTYSINSDGDISFASGAPFVISRVRAGTLVPFKAVQQQG